MALKAIGEVNTHDKVYFKDIGLGEGVYCRITVHVCISYRKALALHDECYEIRPAAAGGSTIGISIDRVGKERHGPIVMGLDSGAFADCRVQIQLMKILLKKPQSS